jgi:hypothetical protein
MPFGGKLPPAQRAKLDQEEAHLERYRCGGFMINPVTSGNVPLAQAEQTRNVAPAAKPPAQPQQQDTVQLSHAAAGDVDHDGDSH